ncbi:MAG: PqiC family protein, partial [Candidatus Cloacimonetes bacterium]|nr:PqiC family protein [Candidatus Cloacimonadota bacterium]
MKRLIYTLPLIVLLAVGCSIGQVSERNYYILEYYNHTENHELVQETPLDMRILISETQIPRTYSRKQIAVRSFGPKLSYSDNNSWAGNLSELIPTLIDRRMDNYNIASLSQVEFISENPQYELKTKINNLELFISEYNNEMVAHINM